MSAGAAPVAARRDDVAILARGAGVALGGRLLGRLAQLGGQLALGRLLGPIEFGLYAIGWTLIRMVGVVAIFGLDKGVIYFGTRHWHRDAGRLRGVILSSVWLAAAIGAGVGVLQWLLAPWLAAHVFHSPALAPVLVWFAPAYVPYAALRVAAAATRTTERMQFSVLSQDLAQPLLALALILAFAVAGWRLFGAVFATTLSFVLAFALAAYFVRRLFPEAWHQGVRAVAPGRSLITYSLPTSLAGMSALYLIWTDRLMLGFWRPAGEVGIYQAATNIAIIFAIVLTGLGTIFTPMIARLYAAGETERLEHLFRVSTKWGLYVSLPALVVTLCAPGLVLRTLFGSAYAGGATALIVLTVGQGINVATGSINGLLIMTGRQRAWFHASVAMLVFAVLANCVLIPAFGMVGASVSTAVSLTGQLVIGLLIVKRDVGLWPYDRRYVKGLVSAIGATAVFLGVRWLPLSGPPAVILVLGGVAATAAFGGLLLVFGLDPEDRQLASMIRRTVSASLRDR